MPSYTCVVLSLEGVLARREYFAELARFAYVEAAPWLRARWDQPEVRALVAELHRQQRRDLAMGRNVTFFDDNDPEAAIAYALQLLREDRADTPAGDLRTCLWGEAFESGRLDGELFSDVPAALGRWRKAGVTVCLFAGVPVDLQRRVVGNLQPLIDRWYGPERGRCEDHASYAAIAADLSLDVGQLLVVVATVPAAYAALDAGAQAVLMERQGVMGTPPHGARVEVSLAAI